MAVEEVDRWWDVFHDPVLSGLIERSMNCNPQLMAAAERIEQARDLARMAASRLFPQLNFDPSYSNAPLTSHVYGVVPTPPPTLIKDHLAKYTLPFTLLYEIDFWGKWWGQYKAGKFRVQAEEWSYQALFLILTTDLANAYFQLRVQDAEIDLLKKILATRLKTLAIHQARFESKLNDYSNVASSQVDYSRVESEYYEALRKRSLFENQIAVLLGDSPSEFKLDSMPLDQLPPEISATSPKEVLLRRPDLAEQERIMAALHAEINVAYASYFPGVDITGIFAPLAKGFIETVKRKWLFGTNVTQVLFAGGGRSANVARTRAKFNEASFVYREKVLRAFQEVEDALASLDWIANEMKAIDTAIHSSQINYQISLDRYHYGLSNYLPASDRERKALDTERLNLQLLGQRYLYTIHLIKAIGGGWK